MMKQMILAALGVLALAVPGEAATTFGSKLNHEPTPAEKCNANKPGDMCSWVLTTAQQNVGGETAPRNGTIAQLKLRSCSSGSFVLQLARAKPGQNMARAVRSGPAITYKGDPRNCKGSTIIETFAVSVPVEAGEYLAVIATKVGFIYNASGDGSHVFDPLLPDGGALRNAGDGLGSGILLLQAVYSD
jgi:hypothetical protein